MRTNKRRRSVRRQRRSEDDTSKQTSTPNKQRQPEQRQPEQRQRQGPFYRAGPVFNLGTVSSKSKEKTTEPETNTPGDGVEPALTEDTAATTAEPLEEEQEEAGPAPAASGAGSPAHSVVFARTSLTLRGRTDADFDGGTFHTENVRVRRAEGCEGCSDDCLRITGTLVATYHVTTTVTLPSADDFPDLTTCQRQRVQHAIDNVLAPHEQQHVRAFEQYNGMTRRRFDLTLCRSQFDGRIQAMFDAEASSRQRAAQAASDALDPFNFTVDLDCEEPGQTGSAQSARSSPSPQPTELTEPQPAP